TEQGIDEQDIFDRMILFLAAITLRLFRRVLGADDAPLGAVMGKRGEAGGAGGTGTPGSGGSSTGGRWGAPSVSSTRVPVARSRARAVRERAGASPRARSAASNAGNRTWIH